MAYQSYNTAVVYVDKSHPEGSPINRQKIDGSWPLHSPHPAKQAAYLAPFEFLIAVAYRGGVLTIIDVRRVVSYNPPNNNTVDFNTVPTPILQNLIVGQPSPVTWIKGDAWPIKEIFL